MVFLASGHTIPRHFLLDSNGSELCASLLSSLFSPDSSRVLYLAYSNLTYAGLLSGFPGTSHAARRSLTRAARADVTHWGQIPPARMAIRKRMD
jgi:hypothetical protein